MAVPKRRLQSHFNDRSPLSKALPPSYKLQCFSVACLDMPHLEFGDKVVLPPCLKIPTPFFFMARAGEPARSSDQCFRQYCSVQEFSAPDGQVFLPYWMMQNLHLPEGGSVVVTSVANLPRGIYCRLQPETTQFLDLAAEIGPKLLMETAMRKYSVLSANSTIVIEYGSERYYVRVSELKPTSVVSLCGDVDLEMDFMPPRGSNPTRPSTGKSASSNASDNAQPASPDSFASKPDCQQNILSTASCYGRRLRDGGYVESTIGVNVSALKVKPHGTIPMCSLQKAQQNVGAKQSKPVSTDAIAGAADTSTLAAQLRSTQGSFSTPGYTLGTTPLCQSPVKQVPTNTSERDRLKDEQTTQLKCSGSQSNVQTCNLCLSDVSVMNMEIHTLRCAKNPAYHKFVCFVCHQNVLRIDENQHLHCPDCSNLYESSDALTEHQQQEHIASHKCKLCCVVFTRAELQDHPAKNYCEHALVPCLLCGLAFKKKDMAQHSVICSSRTERCDVCKTYIKIADFSRHQAECEVLQYSTVVMPNKTSEVVNTHPPRITKSSNQTSIACVYCLQGPFSSITAVEHHAVNDCRIAKSFAAWTTTPSTSSNQDEAEQPAATNSVNTQESPSSEVSRPQLAQGRIRRRGDVRAVRSSSSSRLQRTPPNTNNQLGQVPTSTSVRRRSPPGLPTLLQPSGILPQPRNLRKPKPRPNPQLRSVLQRASKPVKTPESPRVAIKISSSGLADLCISNAGSTLHHVVAPQSHPRTNKRTRRPGRLDKLS